MDNFTEAMILKKIKESGRAIINPDTLKQSFGTEEEVATFMDKHNLRCSEAQDRKLELRKKGS